MDVSSLGRYKIDSELGRGTMGVVYRGHDPVIDRPVAIKTVLLPETLSSEDRNRFLERFFMEARIAGKLIHPNVVVTYDAETDESTGVPFIAMEFVEGTSLDQLLAEKGKLPWNEALAIAIPLASALDHAHEKGIVHRDIKPANVIITHRGIPKLADFGIAKLPSAHLTQTGVIIGTPYFMSPEQLRGEKLDGRSDLFSLAALLYNLVAGQPPFCGSELAAIASQVLYKDPQPLSASTPDIPPSLDGVMARALVKAPDERYATGEEFAEDLLAVKRGSAPRRALSLGERTQVSTPATPSPAAQEQVSQARPARDAIASLRNIDWMALRALKGKLLHPSRRRMGAILILVLLAATYFYRGELFEQMHFYDARSAIEEGDLALGERKLEDLVETSPDFNEATELLLTVSSELVLPSLPEELSAKHDHRLGSCTGKLTLHDWGIEYRSRSHGTWQWRFENARAIDNRGSWGISVETHEDDMLGLLSTKNYNFILLGDPLDEELWKRFERLYQHRRAERETGAQ